MKMVLAPSGTLLHINLADSNVQVSYIKVRHSKVIKVELEDIHISEAATVYSLVMYNLPGLRLPTSRLGILFTLDIVDQTELDDLNMSLVSDQLIKHVLNTCPQLLCVVQIS